MESKTVNKILDMLLSKVKNHLPDDLHKIIVSISYPTFDCIDFDIVYYDNKGNVISSITDPNMTYEKDFSESERKEFVEYCLADYICNKLAYYINIKLEAGLYTYFFNS